MKVGGVALFCALASCRGQSLAARSDFVEDGVQQVADAAWNGERIEIENVGVTAGGGVAVAALGTDRVSATARMLAVADTTDKTNADRAIVAATTTFAIITAPGVTSVRCGHGTTNGSAAGEESGCDALDISVPVGASDKRVALAVRSGNGKVVVACDAAQLSELTVSASHGTVDVKTATTQGATITIVSDTGEDITVRLPADFQADAIVLDGAPGAVDTAAFPDLLVGMGRGQAGAGAKSITVRNSAGPPGGGRIVLVPQ